MQDIIDKARAAMESADEAYQHAEAAGAPDAVLDDLIQVIDDAEHAYFRACDTWEPIRDCSGVIAANGLVYSDADPGL